MNADDVLLVAFWGWFGFASTFVIAWWAIIVQRRKIYWVVRILVSVLAIVGMVGVARLNALLHGASDIYAGGALLLGILCAALALYRYREFLPEVTQDGEA